jgi:hypothetical protein
MTPVMGRYLVLAVKLSATLIGVPLIVLAVYALNRPGFSGGCFV